MGNSVDIKFPGHKKIHFKKHDETYTVELPNLCVRGVLGIGKRGIERTGQLIVRCDKTGYVTKITFKPLGFLGLWGTWNAVEGHTKYVEVEKGKKKKTLLRTYRGHWDKAVYVTDATEASGEESVFHDFDECAQKYSISPVEIPLEKRPPMDSMRVWGQAIQGILTGDFE